ncbi:L-rhamnose mutarotase [Flavimarina sp. Hel_I_48]|uniref:L-rhamnose mutarotase n=1 Tax=Flavimarina sp. Hel_I_48 TaxID=1392488 RepID=UPI0004DFBEAA|nr:L-rhamnose mutarotase [Flavimarina sp. Hel_I_48]
MKSKRMCFACDLKSDPKLIEEYKEYHAAENTWPAITQSIKDAGILNMEIYLLGNRLFMIMDVDDTFDPDRKKQMDEENPKVQEWEKLMWKFQKQLPEAKNGEKWVEMERVYAFQ